MTDTHASRLTGKSRMVGFLRSIRSSSAEKSPLVDFSGWERRWVVVAAHPGHAGCDIGMNGAANLPDQGETMPGGADRNGWRSGPPPYSVIQE